MHLLFAALILTQAQQPMKPDLLITDADSWIQKPTTLKALRQKVVLLDFWDYTCINCIRTHPYLKEWHKRYHDKGFEIISIHSPEFEFAKSTVNVRAAAKREGFPWHVLNDPKKLNWRQFGAFGWPHRILIAPGGYRKLDQLGEGRYGKMETAIQEEIIKLNPRIKLPAIMSPIRPTDVPGAVCRPVTPEIYTWIKGLPKRQLSYKPEDIGYVKSFTYPNTVDANVVYLSGSWFTAKHHLESMSVASNLKLRYMAKEVNAVLKANKPVIIEVLQDQKPVHRDDLGADVRIVSGKSILKADAPRMYSILRNREWSNRVVELRVTSPGLQIYSFTFATDCVPSKKQSVRTP